MTCEIPSNLNGMALTPHQQSISPVWFPVDALARLSGRPYAWSLELKQATCC